MAEKNRLQSPVKVPENWYLFKFFLLANFLQYLEAGAVPALLLNLSSDFQMDHFEQGLLGGMVYVALSCGGPIGGYLLRHCDHRNVVGSAVLLNNALTLLWSMTPIGFSFSKPLFIFVRFLMGLAQCQLVIFLPLWINEYSPNDRLTKSMGFFQASVPFGVMMGYIIASVVIALARGQPTLLGIQCWRWPFIIEVLLVLPLSVAFNFVPRDHISVSVIDNRSARRSRPSSSDSLKMASNNALKQLEDQKRAGAVTNPLTGYAGRVPSAGMMERDELLLESGESRGGRATPSYEPLSFDAGSGDKMANYYSDLAEQRSRSQLRRQTISTSIFTGASPGMMRKSMDNMALLDMDDDLAVVLTGVSWGGTDPATQKRQRDAAAAAASARALRNGSGGGSSSGARSALAPFSPKGHVEGHAPSPSPSASPHSASSPRSRDSDIDRGERSPLISGAAATSSPSTQHGYGASIWLSIPASDPTSEQEQDMDAMDRSNHSISSRGSEKSNGLGSARRSGSSSGKSEGAMWRNEMPQLDEEDTPMIAPMPSHSDSSSPRKKPVRYESLKEAARKFSAYPSPTLNTSSRPSSRRTNSESGSGSGSGSASTYRGTKYVDGATVDTVGGGAVGSWRTAPGKASDEGMQGLRAQLESPHVHPHQGLQGDESTASDQTLHSVADAEAEAAATASNASTDTASGPLASPGGGHTSSESSAPGVRVGYRGAVNKSPPTSECDELTTPASHTNANANAHAVDHERILEQEQQERRRMLESKTRGTDKDKAKIKDKDKEEEAEKDPKDKDSKVAVQKPIVRVRSKENLRAIATLNAKAGIPQDDDDDDDDGDTQQHPHHHHHHRARRNSRKGLNGSGSGSGSNSNSNSNNSIATADSHPTLSVPNAQGIPGQDQLPPSERRKGRGDHVVGYGSKSWDGDEVDVEAGPSSPVGQHVLVYSSSDSESASDEEWEGFSPKATREQGLGDGTAAKREAKPICSNISSLFGIKVYRYLLAAMAALYFTVTGVQYWGTSYMLAVLKTPPSTVHALFIITAATGPTSGVFFGGWAVDSLGGYRGARQRVVALELCCLFAVLGGVFSLPITFISNIYVVSGFLWVLLFFGGAVLPATSGIIVSIVPQRHRPLSASISLVVYNLFGYCASLVLSGYLMQVLEKLNPKCKLQCTLTWGFRLVLFWSFWSMLFLALALRTSYAIVQTRLQAMQTAWMNALDDENFTGHVRNKKLMNSSGSGSSSGLGIGTSLGL